MGRHDAWLQRIAEAKADIADALRCVSLAVIACALPSLALPAPASFSPLPMPVSCIEPVKLDAKADKSGAETVATLRMTGPVHILSLAGNYDRGQTPARAAVSRHLIEETGRDVDFIVVFTDFEIATGEALAFYNAIRNDTRGIGEALYDHSAFFGSEGRLQGYVDMAAMSRYQFNAYDPGYRLVLNTLSHELMHRWGVRVRYRGADGQPESSLLGRDGAHWNLLLDTSASVMYGGSWQLEADGGFRIVEARERFSPWDLYLAGFASPEEVPAARLLRGSALDPSELPVVGMRTQGAVEDIRLQQVIDFEGAREPSASEAQRNFTAALVLLVRPDQPIDESRTVQLQRFASSYQAYFQAITQGRASLHFIEARQGAARPGAPALPVGSVPQRHADPVASGLAWLKDRQQADGGFADRPASAVRDTAAALRTILQVDPAWSGAAAARALLQQRLAAHHDDQLRLAAAGVSAEPVEPASALVGHWTDSPFDLALSAAQDADAALFVPEARQALLARLLEVQSAEGGFASIANGASRLRASLHATRALLAMWPDEHVGAERARTWLLERLLALPLQGSESAGSSELADALVIAGELRLPETLRLRFRAALESRQGEAGDWEGSVYSTAVATLALAKLGQPDLDVQGVSHAPELPLRDEPVVLHARLRNSGGTATPQSRLVWARESPAGSGQWEEIAGQVLPSLIPGESLQVALQVETRGWQPVTQLRLSLDPDDSLVELNEDNNRAELTLAQSVPGEHPDLALVAGEHAFSPPSFRRVGDQVRLQGQVRNLGGRGASAALLRLERVQSSVRRLLAEARLDVPANSQASYALDFAIQSTGDHALELSIDPLQESADPRRENNVLILNLAATAGVDLSFETSTLALQPVAPRVGADLRVRVLGRNSGNSPAMNTNIELQRLEAGAAEPIQRLPLQLEAGGERHVEFIWRPEREGTQGLRLVLDPDGRLEEVDENNNSLDFEIEAVRADGVDLVVLPGSTRSIPAQPLQGGALRVESQLLNQGALAAAAYSVGLYLGDPLSGGQRLAATSGPRLEPGAAAAVAIEISAFPARGDVSLFLMADSELAIGEIDENNNTGIIDTIARALPDAGISAQSISLEPQMPLPGLPVSLRASVSNRGEQPTEPVLAHLHEIRAGERFRVGTQVDVPALDPGGQFEAAWDWIAGVESADALLLQLDPERQGPDGDRGNNEVSLPVSAGGEGSVALIPFFSPNGDGVRDRAAAVFAASAADIERVDVLDAEGRLVNRLLGLEGLPGARSVVWWDGLDAQGRTAPDGQYILAASGAAARALGSVRVVLDNDRPMALGSVLKGEVATRRLPPSIHPWLTPPSGSSAEDYLYTFGDIANPATTLKQGIARTHAFMGGVEPVLSARWLQRHANGAPVTSLLIEPRLGRELVFTADNRIWVQEVDTLDQPRLVATLPQGMDDVRLLATDGGRRVILQDEQFQHLVWADLDSGLVAHLSHGGERFVRAYSEGVLVGSREPVDGGYIPSRFLRFDSAQAEVRLNLDYFRDIDCFARVQLAGDEPAAFWHVLGVYGERVQWVDFRTGAIKDVFSKAEGGCPGASPSRAPKQSASLRVGFAQARVQWIDALGSAILIEHERGKISVLSARGDRTHERDFAQPQLVGDYGVLQGRRAASRVRGEPVGESGLCPVRLSQAWSEMSRWPQLGRSSFNPQSREVFVVSGEVLLDKPVEYISESGAGAIEFACEGATDYLVWSLDSGALRREAGHTGWPMNSPEDRARYALVPASAAGTFLPPEWPRFFQAAEHLLSVDGRIRIGAGSGRIWSRAAELLASVHHESRLLLTEDSDRLHASVVVSSIERMRADLRASSNGRSVSLFGYATDANLDFHLIDYARVDAPDQWLSLVPPVREQVRGDDFLTWSPPQSGAYLFRLRVVDRAGNRRDSFASAELVFASPISQVRSENRAISPNGDGIKDQARIDFVVSRPTELEFRVLDSAGRAVHASALNFGVADLGPGHWSWDGRGNDGVVVPDGLYRIELSQGFGFPLALDTVQPTLEGAALSSTYPPQKPAARLGGVFDRRGQSDTTHELEVYLEHRAASDASWRRHPAAYDAATRSAGLQWLELFDGRYRWVAEDRAGNRGYAEMPAPDRTLVFTGAVADWARAQGSGDDSGVWQAKPFAERRMGDLPLHLRGGGAGSATLVPAPGRALYFLADYEESRPIVLDVSRTAGASAPLGEPVRWAARSELLPQPLGDGWFRLDVDFSELQPEEVVGVRLRDSASGSGRVSNAMRFNSPGARLECRESGQAFAFGTNASGIERVELVGFSDSAVRPDRHFEGIKPAAQPGDPIGWEWWNFRGTSGLQRASLRVRVWLEGETAPVWLRSDFRDCDRTLPNVGSPAVLTVLPHSEGGCGAGVSSQVRAIPRLPEGSRRFRLELMDPRQISREPVVSAIAADLAGAGYLIDTSGLPGSEGVLHLHVEGGDGEWTRTDARFPLDRTPPEVAFTAPAPGARLCSIAGAQGGVDALMETDSSAVYALEAASLTSGEPRYTRLRCNHQRPGEGPTCSALDDSLSSSPELDIRSFSQRLLSLPASELSDGPTGVRIRALDWSGAQTCATTQVHIDASAQVEERRDPQPQSLGSAPPSIAPEGDVDLRLARWFFRAQEPVQVHAAIHATRAEGPPANPIFRIEGPALEVLRDGSQAAGSFDIDWSGQLQGEVAPDAVYGLRIRVQDECGHEREFERFVRVDSTPPAIEIVSPPEGAELRQVSVQIVGTVRDHDPDTYEVLFSTTGPQGPWQQLLEGRGNVASPRVLAAVPAHGLTGQVWLQLRARDRVGNTASLVRRVVLLPRPDVLSSARLSRNLISPNGDGRLDSLELKLVLAREARLDIDLLSTGGQLLTRLAQAQPTAAGAFELAWGGQVDTVSIPDGGYRLRVRAFDAQLGGEPDEVELDLIVDTVAPVLAWSTEMPAVLSCDRPPMLTVEDPLLAEFRAELQDVSGAVRRETAGRVEGVHGFDGFDRLDEGAYRLVAVALDAAGNRSESEGELVLDCTAPALSLIEPASDSVLARHAGVQHRLSGRAEDANPSAYRLDLVPVDDPQARQTLLQGLAEHGPAFELAWSAEVPDGSYLLELEAQDQAGNPARLSTQIRIDGTPPQAQIHAPAEGDLVRADVILTATAMDTNFAGYALFAATPAEAERDSWSLLFEGAAPIDGATLPTLQGLAQGEWLFRLDVRDRAGLQARAERRLRIDAVPPPAPIELTAQTELPGRVRLTWRGGDAPDLAGFHVYRHSNEFAERITPAPVTQRQYLDVDVSEGVWAYEVSAVDQVGNESPPSNRVQIRIDLTPPEALILQPGAGETVRGLVSVRGTAAGADDFERYELSLLDANGEALRVLRESSSAVRGGELGVWDTRALAEGQRFGLRVRAWDRSGNHAESQLSIEVDNLPPAAPQGLTGELRGPDLDLGWLPNAEPDLLGYLLYRNGRLLTAGGSLPADLRPLALGQNAYLDAAVPDGQHVYRVYAIDRAGNLSLPSAPYAPEIEQGPPSAELVRPEDGLVFDQAIEVLAETEHRDVAAIAFFLRAAGEQDWQPLGPPVTSPPWRQAFDPGGRAFGEFELQAVATDRSGLSDPQPPSVRVRYQDVTPPPAPAHLQARADGASIHLSWTASSAPDLASYHLERFNPAGGWEEIETLPATSLASVDAGREVGIHRYRLIAADGEENRSEPSAEAAARVYAIDLHPLPHTPSAAAQTVLSGNSPRAGTLHVQREQGGEQTELASGPLSADRSFSIEADLLAGSNLLRATVVDAEGHRSLAAEVIVTRGNLPAAPGNLQGAVDADQVQLQWSSTAGIAGYRIYRNGAPVFADLPLAQTLQVESRGQAVPAVLDGDSTTAWSERTTAASDQLRERLEVRWPVPALVGVIELEWSDAARSARDFDLYGWYDGRWNLLSEVRNQSGTSYRLDLATAYPTEAVKLVPRRSQWPGSTHALAELRVLARGLSADSTWTERVADGRHVYTVTPVSPLGFEGPHSQPWVAEVGDAEAPPPVVLSGVADGRDALLSWTASEAADLRRYRVLRGVQLIAEIAAGEPRTFRDPNLPNGEHRYRVEAEDAAGNRSVASNEAVIAISGEGPGVPVITQARSQPDQPAIELHWRAGEGTPAVSYRLFASLSADDPAEPYREVGRATNSPWLHTGLSYGLRLYYRVQAEDAAGTLSALSAPFEAQVRDLRTPSTPYILWPAPAPAQLDWTESRYEVCGIAEPGHAIDLRVNGESRAAAVARATSELLPIEQGGSQGVMDVALSPDGRRLAWIDESGSVRERELETGATEERWLWRSGQLQYSQDGLELQGLYGDGRHWSVWSETTGEQTFDFGLDRVDRALRLGRSSRWIVSGLSLAREGLWWVEAEDAQPVAIEIPSGESAQEFVADAQSRTVFIRTETGLVLHWPVASATAQPLSLPEPALALRAHPLESAAFALLESAGRRQIWRLDANGARVVLDTDEQVLDFAFAGAGDGLWLLTASELVRHEFDSASAIERLRLDGAHSFARLLSSRVGRLIAVGPQGSTAMQRMRSAGAWCAPAISALAGRNSLVAVARNAAGVRSGPSAVLELDYDPALAQLPDLVIEAADIRLLPGFGVAGQPHALSLGVRNIGRDPAQDVLVAIEAVSPQGASATHVRRTWVEAGEQVLLNVPLGLLAEGQHRVKVELDADGSITEANESNNRAEASFEIGAQAEPRLALSVSRSRQPPGEAFEGLLRLAVPTRFNGRIELWIADRAGAVVEPLPALETGEIAAGALWVRPWRWSPRAGLLADGYRLHARLRDPQGVSRAEETLDLQLDTHIELALSLQTSAAELPVGQPLAIGLGLEVEAVNSALEGGRLQLWFDRAEGSSSLLWSGSTGALVQGYRLRRNLSLPTELESTGEHQLRLDFLAEGTQREVSRSLRLVPAQELPALHGALRIAPSASLALGQPARLQYSLGNRSTAVLTDQRVRVQVSAGPAGAPILAEQYELSLDAGQSQDFELDLGALPQRPAQYQAVLQADGAEGWRTLAQLGFGSVDVEAPLGEIVAPGEGLPVRTPAYFEALIRDRHSSVDGAEFSLNSAAWRSLPGAGAQFASLLDGLPDGSHRIEVRADDIWGNRRVLPARTLVVDNTAPRIQVGGVADGDLLGASVTPVFDAEDAHLAEVQGWLNGTPLSSATPVTEEGVYRLEVHAADAAGNRAQRTLSFVLDFTAPTLAFAEPVDGAEFASPAIAVELSTEPRARVQLVRGSWQVEADADADGRVLLGSVPLDVGLNVLEAEARDGAGNRSSRIQVQVTRIRRSEGLFGELLLDRVGHPRAEPLSIGHRLVNDTGANVQGERILRIESATGQVLAEHREALSLAGGEVREGSEAWPTADWVLGPAAVRLLFDDGGGPVELSSRGLSIDDRTPPRLDLLQPLDGALVDSPVPLRIEASDDDALAEVRYRIDDGSWVVLAPASGAYAAELALPDGSVRLEAQARDRSGNLSPVQSRQFTVDASAPEILIEGVSADGLYGEPVRPQVRMLDAHPGELQLRLNDQPWTSGEVVDRSGRYRLQARASDQLGHVSEQRIEFELDLEPVTLQLFTPAEGAVLGSPEVDLLGQTKPLARVVVQGPMSSHEVRADASGQFRVEAVPLNVGTNAIQIEATDALGRRSEPLTRQLEVDESGRQGLVGELESAGQIGLEQAWPLSARVRDSLGRARAELSLRVLIERPDQPSSELDWVTSIEAGAEHLRELDPPAQTVPGTVSLRLQASLDGQWVELAQRSLPVRDLTPPRVDFESPGVDSYHREAIAVAAVAEDAHSPVERVEARLIGGAWTALQPDAVGSLGWTGALATDAEGTQLIELRALDAAMNWSPPQQRRVHVDRTSPQIRVEGVESDGVYGERRRVQVSVDDASPVQLVLRLNGQTFASGDWVDGHGSHQLSATATDAAGNVSTQTLSFELDLEAPGVSIASPGMGEIIGSPEVSVLGHTEALAQLQLRAADIERSLRADASGRFHFERVPLRVGRNRIELRAIDAVGNTGAWTVVEVERRGGFALRGELQAPAEAERGAELPVRMRIWNDSDQAVEQVHLRLIARDAAGIERTLETRTQQFAAGQSLEHLVRPRTQDWAQGVSSLRLVAADANQIQLASVQVNLRAPTAGPPLPPQPRVIPVGQPYALLLLVLGLILAARRQRQRQERRP